MRGRNKCANEKMILQNSNTHENFIYRKNKHTVNCTVGVEREKRDVIDRAWKIDGRKKCPNQTTVLFPSHTDFNML